jgi:hypothetical protein
MHHERLQAQVWWQVRCYSETMVLQKRALEVVARLCSLQECRSVVFVYADGTFWLRPSVGCSICFLVKEIYNSGQDCAGAMASIVVK